MTLSRMTSTRTRIGAILLASAMATAVPLAAQARGPGGGGAHFGGGGGGAHFGGGGAHFGGGGMHFGGGGGGMHFGGGGLHLGGGHFGGIHLGHFGGLHIGGLHFGGRGLRFGGRGLHVAGLHTRGLTHSAHLGSHVGHHAVTATRALHENRVAGRSAAARDRVAEHNATAHESLAGRDTAGRDNLAGQDSAGRVRTADRAGRDRGDRGGRFASRGNWNRFRGAYGWAGPLFWPYAYDDLYDDIFWGYGYDPFWDYGYGDIFGGLFSPYGFDDLAGYLPGGGGYVSNGGGGNATGGTGTVSRGTANTAPSLANQLAQMCGADTKEVAGYPIDRIQQLVSPNDQQRAALDDLANASVKAAQIIKQACPTAVSFTPTGRLEAMQARLEAMAQAIDVVRGPLDRFYATLTDEQKARLNAANQSPDQQAARSRVSLVQNCNAANDATRWPAAQIEKAVHPTQPQLPKFDALKSAVDQAALQLGASCLSQLPATPPARLAADAKRIDGMLQAVKNVRGALDDLYASLNDEQKAQFNMIGQSRTAQR